MDSRDPRVLRDRLVLRDLRDSRVLGAPRERQEPLEPLDLRGRQAARDRSELQGRWVSLGLLDSRDSRDPRDRQVLRETEGQQDPRDLKDLVGTSEHRGLRDSLDNLASQVSHAQVLYQHFAVLHSLSVKWDQSGL